MCALRSAASTAARAAGRRRDVIRAASWRTCASVGSHPMLSRIPSLRRFVLRASAHACALQVLARVHMRTRVDARACPRWQAVMHFEDWGRAEQLLGQLVTDVAETSGGSHPRKPFMVSLFVDGTPASPHPAYDGVPMDRPRLIAFDCRTHGTAGAVAQRPRP